MDDASVPQQSTNQSSFFEGTNRYLIIVLGLFILILIGLAVYIMLVKKAPLIEPTTETVPNQQQTSLPSSSVVTPLPMLLETQSKQNPMNKMFFENIQRQVQKTNNLAPYIAKSQVQGIIVEINSSSNSLEIYLESEEKNMLGKKIWFVYPQQTLSKIIVYSSQSKKQKILPSDLKKGNRIFIEEDNNYSKQFPDSIIGVDIIKLLD